MIVKGFVLTVTGLAVMLTVGGFASAQQVQQCLDKVTLIYTECPQEHSSKPIVDAGLVENVEPSVWTGFYLGLHAGYGGSETTGAVSSPGIGTFQLDELSPIGPLVGGQIGYMRQYESDLVLGVEGDFSFSLADDHASQSFSGSGGSANVEGELEWLTSARLRAGYATGDVMPYVTTGVAWAQYYSSGNFRNGAGATVESFNGDGIAFGTVFGGGVEWMLDENLLLRGEGLYYNFDSDTNISGSPTGDTLGLEDTGAVRFNFSYKFP